MIITALRTFGQRPLLPSSRIYRLDFCGFSRITCLCGKTALYPKNVKKSRAKKEVAAFTKVFGDHHARKRRKKWLDDVTGLFPQEGSSGKKSKGPSVGSQRRAQHLSVVLHDEIRRILDSGEVGPQLKPLGFHITMVDLPLDFSAVNVRWEADGSERDAKIEQYLPQCAFDLRRALSSYRVMGTVPPIQFIKDSTAHRLKEVERLLDIADVGPDYERPELGKNMKTPKPIHDQETLQESISKAALNFKDQNTVTQISPTGAMEVVMDNPGTEIDEESIQPLPIESDFADLKITSNAYDVDRAAYALKIMQLKKQSVRRTGTLGDRMEVSQVKETTMDTAKIKDIKKLIALKKWKRSDDEIPRKSKHKGHLSPWTLNVGQDLGSHGEEQDFEDIYEEPNDFYEDFEDAR